MRIYLIGLPGVGKSTVAIALGKRLGYAIVDLDSYIEEKNSISIPAIFAKYGEDYFRKLEHEALKDMLHMDNVIVSTGGGVIKDIDNKKLMDGLRIFLDAPIYVIKNRLKESKIDRPLLHTKPLEELYEERKDKYSYFKDITITNDDLSSTVKKIVSVVASRMKVLVINGPNLNMLGKRDKNQYGEKTLEEINDDLKKYSPFPIDFYQSNHEGDIVTKIQESLGVYDGIIINPGAYTHTSIAIRDALDIIKAPKIEVHLSNIYEREDFRKINYIKDVCTYSVVGMKEKGYFIAIDYLKKHYNVI